MIKNIILVVLLVFIGFLLISKKAPNVVAPTKQESTTNSSNEIKPNDKANSKTLDLSNQGLDKLPAYVVNETEVEVLDISNNNLTGALPAEIKNLQNLRELNASNNKMTGVPAEIGQLKNLEVLDLSNNQLTGLPYELGNLKNLKTLNLSGNDYAQQDLDIIKKDLPSNVEIITN